MLLKYTSVLLFIFIFHFSLSAKCSGPVLSSSYGGYCPNGPVNYSAGYWSSSDTVSNPVGASDSVLFNLQASNFCPQFDSIEFYKDGILMFSEPHSSAMSYSYASTGPGNYTFRFKLSYWFSYTIIYLPLDMTGINPIADQFDLQVYPNPSINGIFTISSTEDKTFTINVVDIAGRAVGCYRDIHSELVLDLSTLSPGFYSLMYTSTNGRIRNKKLIYSSR
jgi:hypothetical protein